jgi:hypothetical protein
MKVLIARRIAVPGSTSDGDFISALAGGAWLVKNFRQTFGHRRSPGRRKAAGGYGAAELKAVIMFDPQFQFQPVSASGN